MKIRERAVGIIALLMSKEGTARELTERLVNDCCSGAARTHTKKWLDLMHDAGVVYIKGCRQYINQRVPVYAMQPSLFEYKDTPEVTL